jgi:hypothetical protein
MRFGTIGVCADFSDAEPVTKTAQLPPSVPEVWAERRPDGARKHLPLLMTAFRWSSRLKLMQRTFAGQKLS